MGYHSSHENGVSVVLEDLSVGMYVAHRKIFVDLEDVWVIEILSHIRSHSFDC